MHEKDFIHRDLKPENILISTLKDEKKKHNWDYYTAKIADFGLSAEYKVNIYSNSTNIFEKMGTILYMAPEQAQS
jgi:serine/threonine protein kinase